MIVWYRHQDVWFEIQPLSLPFKAPERPTEAVPPVQRRSPSSMDIHPWISIHGYRWRTERSKIGGSMKLRWFIYENLEMEFRDGLSMETIAATTYSISSGKKGGNPCRPVSLRGWHLQKHQDLSDHSHGMKRCRSSWSKTIYIHYIYISININRWSPSDRTGRFKSSISFFFSMENHHHR